MSSSWAKKDSIESFNKKVIKSNLSTLEFGHPIIFKETTTSTQIDAHRLAKEGINQGATVIAREQTQGRGRLNRPWHSVNNKAISMSIVLRPNVSPNLSPQLTLFAATILTEVLKDLTEANIKIKWPNDILINGKKFVGILTEMKVKKQKVDYIILGIGINVNDEVEDLPLHTKYPISSLFIETGKKWDRAVIIQGFLKHFEHSFPSFLESGFANFKHRWERNSFKLGELLFINDFKNKWHGIFRGISKDGGLLIENEDKNIVKIYSAEIEWYN